MCIGLSVYSVFAVESRLSDLLDTPDQFADFTYLGDTTKQINSAIAVCVFFAWIKLFKYISFNKTMTQLSSTLSRVSINHRTSVVRVFSVSRHFFKTNVTESVAELILYSQKTQNCGHFLSNFDGTKMYSRI